MLILVTTTAYLDTAVFVPDDERCEVEYKRNATEGKHAWHVHGRTGKSLAPRVSAMDIHSRQFLAPLSAGCIFRIANDSNNNN